MKAPYLLSEHKVKSKDDRFLYINIHTVVTCNLNILYFQKYMYIQYSMVRKTCHVYIITFHSLNSPLFFEVWYRTP